MTRHIPEGNSLRDLRNAADILREGFDVWPADADERRIDDFLRRSRARPVAPRPPLRVILAAVAWALLVIALAFGAGWFASKAVANAAAAVAQAEAGNV